MPQNNRVFLIEDDSDIREALAQILAIEGFEVESADNGESAMVQLSSLTQLPHLILLDLIMPIMDGYKFLEERRKVLKLSEIPVLILTANQDRDSSLMAEVQGFLRKPLDIDKLISTMRKML